MPIIPVVCVVLFYAKLKTKVNTRKEDWFTGNGTRQCIQALFLRFLDGLALDLLLENISRPLTEQIMAPDATQTA